MAVKVLPMNPSLECPVQTRSPRSVEKYNESADKFPQKNGGLHFLGFAKNPGGSWDAGRSMRSFFR
jgi:hypothetical protein